jgi:phage terminase large subunit-like protein
MRLDMPERRFAQEMLAEFIEDFAGVFRNVKACATATAQEKRRGDRVYIAGLDWALSYDFTVLTIIDANTRELVFIDRYNGVDYSMQRQRIKAACDRFGIAGMIAEANAMGKPNNDELRRMGLPVRDFVTTNATKADAIESLAAAFEQGNIRILDDATLIAELQAYEVERLPSGMVRYSAPDGMHDDCVISLALAWHGASAAQRKRATVREY